VCVCVSTREGGWKEGKEGMSGEWGVGREGGREGGRG